ncbi:metallophosphoesterase family protein [Clostridium coskatii]|uniref:Alkaline phosphatase n=1 Tax=Clostridium coskatii TaxID=1705578 RepID=A0A166SWE4_9CLOT|nr:metallophosphoesterase [Clostridium coskatii]OAA92858.1 Alkaline phosphatase precursor [Clostridium coskatii]OBR95800.1 alkaline phosphatase precursor [Clostridium coskatii]
MIFVIITAITSCGTRNLVDKEEKTSPYSSTSTEQEKNGSLRFVVMSDCRGLCGGINVKAVEKTLQSIKKIIPQPSFAVMPGDLVQGGFGYLGIKIQLQYFKNTVTKYYPIDFFYPGFGNHEATSGAKSEQAFEETFHEFKANFLRGYHKTVYYFDKNNIGFYMLNSNHPGEDHSISDTQLNWIKANTNLKKHNFYFFHEPAYPTGSHVGSSLDVNKLQRDKLWKIINHAENTMVFCGHEHNYTRRHINSDFNESINGQTFKFNKLVYQVTTGTFGAPLYKDYIDKKNVDIPPVKEYHFAVVDVNESKVEVTVYNLDGKIIDHFEQ